MLSECLKSLSQKFNIFFVTGDGECMESFLVRESNGPDLLALIFSSLKCCVSLDEHVDSQDKLIGSFDYEVTIYDETEFAIGECEEYGPKNKADPAQNKDSRNKESKVVQTLEVG